jgi:hypothetical protein
MSKIPNPERCFHVKSIEYKTFTLYSSTTASVVQVIPNRSLQSRSTFSKHLTQVLQVIPSGETESSDKVLGRSLEIPIIFFSLQAIFRSAKVCVTGDACCTFEAL